MRRLFGTDEAYYAVIFILLLIVNGGFALFGFEKLAGHNASSSWCHCIGNRTNCVQDVSQFTTCLFFIIERHTSEPRGDSVQRFYQSSDQLLLL